MSLLKTEERSFNWVPLVALFVAIVAVVGFLLFSLLLNPPTVPVVVAVADIPAGTIITRDLVGIDPQRMHAKVADVLITESDLDEFIGGVAVQTIYAYQPVPKAAIAVGDNPAAINRLSLALTDPTIVAMTVPVSRETSPSKLVPGDYLDLDFGVGSATFLAGSLSTAPTPFPFQPLPGVFVTQPPLPVAPTVTPTAEPRLTLPVAKTIVHAAKVLSVVYDESPNPAYAGPASGEPATIQGDIIAIVVTIPRDAEELVHFGIVNGSIRIALLAPGNDWSAESGAPHTPTLGMSWDDFVALVRMDRASALATAFPTDVEGPGASAIEATLNARKATTTASGGNLQPTSPPLNVTATVGPTLTATPKP